MGKKKKTNPRRIPVSKATLRKEVEATKETSIDLAMALFLTVMCDKFGFDAEQLQKVWHEANSLSDGVAKGYVDINDLITVLETEYEIKLSR